MHRTRRRLAATATALAVGLALTACAGQAGTSQSPEPATTNAESPADVAAHNDADTQFAQMMVVHHEGAIDMAALAVDRATSPQVRALAERIQAAQTPEIDLMTGWLQAWGEDPAAGGMDHGAMGHGDMPMEGMQMEGMDHGQAMGALDALQGTEFDTRFLELMIAHHEGAVLMAEAELEKGQNPDALEFAQKIIDDQTTEIAEMRELLAPA